VGSAGGFYPYICAGLGRPLGVAGALIALATYNAVSIGVYGLFGFFANNMVKAHGGPDVAWWVYAFALGGVVFLCGIRNIEFSGKVLGLCMIAEISILLLLDLTVLTMGATAQGVTFAPFGASAVFSAGFGVALVFVVTAFLGFEATAIFGEEAREPKRTIPRATYIAVILIALFYAFTTWAIALYYGPDDIQAQAGKNVATLYLDAVKALLGDAAGLAMNLLLVGSLFACALSFHNTVNRYFYAVGREGLAWSGLARTHRDHQSPQVAGAVQTAIAAGVVALFALMGADPYAVVFAWMGTFSSLGVLAVQVLVSLAVIAFFSRDARGVGLWQRLVAPGMSALGLGACLVLMSTRLDLVSGSRSRIIDAFPAMIALIGLAGVCLAIWLRSRKPGVYANLGRTFH
jgi:amino acid transporter